MRAGVLVGMGGAAAMALAAAMATADCGSSSGGPGATPGPDATGGGDTGAIDGASGDAAPSDAGAQDAPTGDGSIASFCQLLSGYQQQCKNLTPACLQAKEAQCEQLYATVLSPVYIKALQDCASTLTCAALEGGVTSDPCIYGEVAAAPRTSAQQQLATDYCAECPAMDPNCAADFFAGPGDGAAAGPGTYAMFFSDSLDLQIDQKCLHADAGFPANADAGTCRTDFLFCSVFALVQAVPEPAVCKGD